MTPEIRDRGRAEQAARERLAREHLLPFVRLTFGARYKAEVVHRLIAEKLERFFRAVEAGESPRLMILLPPRTGKSEIVSRKFPAWCLGHHPEWNIGIVAYGADLAERLSRQCRGTVMSDVYANIFGRFETEQEEPVQIDATSKAVNYWRIKPTKDVPQPGGLLAVGVNGALTGEGFNVLVLDDTLKNIVEARSKKVKDSVYDFYTSTLYDRLEPGAGIILVQQRWALDDLPGRLLDDAQDPELEGEEYVDKWDVLSLAAQAEAGEDDLLGRKPGEWLPARKTAEQWEKLKANIQKRDPYTWSAKFQQRPLPAAGTVFFRENFRFEEDPDEDGPVYLFADTSYARRTVGDYSVIGAFRFERRPRLTIRLLEVYRKRATFPDLRMDAARLAWKWRPKLFVVEDAGSGKSLIQEFAKPIWVEQAGMFIKVPVWAWNPQREGDKDARAHAASAVVRRGDVALPQAAPWLADFLDEVCSWQGEGTTQFDDQLDVLTMACILLGVQEPHKKWEPRYMPFAMTG